MSRHANAGRKLSRNTSHRKALLDNLVRAVILNEIKEILTTMGLGLGMRVDQPAGASQD